MTERTLQEQVAIVTGASHGIGEAVARKLCALGAKVVLAARNQARLDSLARELESLGGSAISQPTDLRQPEQIRKLIEVAAALGRIDLLVNNAGIGAFGSPLHETGLETWDGIMETNLRAVYLAMRFAAPVMIRQRSGQMINISSLAAHNPVPMGAVYAASKWGLNGMSYAAAEELRSYGIRVSVICPGSVDTDLAPNRGKHRNRMLQPEDVAHVVAMLATQSERSFASEVLLRPTLKP